MAQVLTLLLFVWGTWAAPNGQNSDPTVDEFSSVVLTAGGCLDGTKIAEMGCYRYKECVEGVWVTRTCPINQLFGDGQCRMFTEVDCGGGSVFCTPGTKTAYPKDCQKYLLCNDNHDHVVVDRPSSNFPALYKYVFDPASSECKRVWGWKAGNCEAPVANAASPQQPVRNEVRQKREVLENPDDCIEGDSKYDTKPGVCSTYMYCQDGRWARRACEKGQFYNDEKKECGSTPCPFEAIPGNCDSFRTADGQLAKCDFGMIFDKFQNECVEYANGTCAEIECEGLERKNHPTDCGRYLQCSKQQWQKQSCGWFRNKFDIGSRTCVFGWFNFPKASWSCQYDPADCAEGVIVPVAGNCRQYLSCKDKTLQKLSCLWPMSFDVSSSKCVWWGAKCY